MESPSLAEYLHFNEDDLQANRNGWVSDRQKASMALRGLPEKASGVGCGLGFFAIASIFPIVWLPVLKSGELDTGEFIGISIAVVIWALIWGAIGLGIVSSTFAPEEVELDYVEGVASIDKVNHRASKYRGRYTSYKLLVGERKFDLKEDFSDCLQKDQSYMVYFVKGKNRILSMEPVGTLKA